MTAVISVVKRVCRYCVGYELIFYELYSTNPTIATVILLFLCQDNIIIE